MQAKLDQVAKYWAGSTPPKIDYANFDPDTPSALRRNFFMAVS